jgi:hypothetical protein
VRRAAGFIRLRPQPALQINLQMLTDGRLELAPCWFEQQRMFAGV